MMVPAKYSKLAGILKIGDSTARQQSLMDYAGSLNINITNVRKLSGDIDEDQLTVLIFNAERTRTMLRLGKTGFFLGVFFIFIMLIAAMFLFLKF